VQFAVETWDPGYGTPIEISQMDAASESVDLEVECEEKKWKPITPSKKLKEPESIIFIDGVRRFDAHIWLNDTGNSHRGICATVAAGAVRCTSENAEIEQIHVERALHTSAEISEPIELRNLNEAYKIRPTTDDSSESLNFSVHNHMARIEDLISQQYETEELVIFDGPLNQRHVDSGVGYVKTQHVQYLSEDLTQIIPKLKDGQRTPVFRIEGRFDRWSWFLRLPNPSGPQASGIVRLELPTSNLEEIKKATLRADLVSRILPKYASESFKESRAPQNLYPIAGLERQMRWRLGDRDLLERGLRVASMPSS